MAKPVDEREREELCDLLLQLGPDAPTLCEGWTTADLAAHLVLREHFKRSTNANMASEKSKGLPTVVARLRKGAPLIPWRIPGLRGFLNGSEYFIHHEDVRRANGMGPRPNSPDLINLCWRVTGLLGRRIARVIRPSGLELRRPDAGKHRFGSEPYLVVTGEPTELLLYVAGRRSAAEVVITGPPDARTALESSKLGL